MKNQSFELKETLLSIDDTLKRIESILLCLEQKQNFKSSEEYYKEHGIHYSIC